MPVWTEEILNPSPVENTTITKQYMDGVFKIYSITPNEGYVLHDITLADEVYDPETGEPTGEIIPGYYEGTRTVAASYDFVTNPRQFYAVLRSEVPNDNICGTTGPTPEVM